MSDPSQYNFGNGNVDSGGGGGYNGRTATEPTPADIAKDVVIIFLFGIAILVGLAVLVYLIALMVYHFCCCCGFQALHTNGPRYTQGGEVARDAGLSGMTAAERRAILEKILVSKPYRKPLASDGGSEEETEAVRKGENCTIVTVPSADETAVSVTRDGMSQAEVSLARSTATPNTLAVEVEPANLSANEAKAPEISIGAQSGESVSSPFTHESNTTCAICINEYAEGDEVILGDCSHMFHKGCLLEWLDKHDVCPFCRKVMMTSSQMREVAEDVLGHERRVELSMSMGFYPAATRDVNMEAAAQDVEDQGFSSEEGASLEAAAMEAGSER